MTLNLDLNLLITFDALLDERSVSRTAKRFGMSQTAVSAQLARLRDHFEDPLFTSNGRGVEPTAFALQLAQPVRDVVWNAQQIAAARHFFEPSTAQRRFALTAGSRDIGMLLAEVNRRVGAAAPGIQMTVAPFSSHPDQRAFSVSEMLERQGYDFALIPEGFHASTHPVIQLFRDRYVALADRDHPDIGDALTVGQYRTLTHAAVQLGGRGMPSILERHLHRTGEVRRVGPVVESYGSLPYFITGTRFIAIVTSAFAHAVAPRHGLRVLELPVTVPVHSVVMQWAHRTHTDAAAIWFREQIVATARDLLPSA